MKKLTVFVYVLEQEGFFKAQAVVGTPEKMSTGESSLLIFPDFSTEWCASRNEQQAVSYALSAAAVEIERRKP